MNLFLVQVTFLRSLFLVFFLLFSFSLQAKAKAKAKTKVVMPVEGRELDCGNEIANFANNLKDIDKGIKTGLWTNTEGRIREITEEEEGGPINAVGTVVCKKNNGKSFSSTATLAMRGKGEGQGPVILLAGHSVCNGDTRLPANRCVFQHTYAGNDTRRYGKVYEHKFKKISTNFECGDDTFKKDIAVAVLEDFDGYWNSTVTFTDSVEKKRYIDDEGNIKYSDPQKDRYDDATMLLVGYDAIYKKLMISENCGLIDKSEAGSLDYFTDSQMTHDCLQTPGYSGGPIFQKRWDKKEKKYEYNLVCVNSGDRTYKKPSHSNYRIMVEGLSGGRCQAIERESLVLLFKDVGRM